MERKSIMGVVTEVVMMVMMMITLMILMMEMKDMKVDSSGEESCLKRFMSLLLYIYKIL